MYDFQKLEKVGVIFYLAIHVSHPKVHILYLILLPKSLLTFLFSWLHLKSSSSFSAFTIPLSFFLLPSSPLLTRQPSLSHQNILTLSKEEITGLRLKFQLQIVGGKKSKLHLFISTSLTSTLTL